MSNRTPREQFLELIAGPEDRIDLAAAALLIAKEEYPDLDVPAYTAAIDRLADRAAPGVRIAGANPFAVIDALNTFLFHEEGFRGDIDDYYDPRNSYLNDVLDRRRGIPITLSVLYMEVARRLDFPVHGVGFPGHFMVRHAGGGRDILIDPFHEGEILMPDDCRSRLREICGDETRLAPEHLASVGKRQILARMLNNLRRIHLDRGDDGRAVSVIDRLLAVAPADASLLRDRGMIHLRALRYGRASADFESYLSLAPDAGDATEIAGRLKTIRRLTAMMN